jgi:hypothetical protein
MMLLAADAEGTGALPWQESFTARLDVFRRGVPSMIGNGVSSFQFSEINGLAGSRWCRWGSFLDQHSQPLHRSSYGKGHIKTF